MFNNKNHLIDFINFKKVIDNYNNEYGNNLNVEQMYNVCLNSKIMSKNVNMEFYFSNKSYLAYFVANNLLRKADENTNIEYVLSHMCMGINSDIILFITYSLKNTKVVMEIVEKLKNIVTDWDFFDLTNTKDSFIFTNEIKVVKSPTQKEYQSSKKLRNTIEEISDNENKLIVQGVFDFDENKLETTSYKITLAVKYLEFLSKSLPRFNSILKVEEKDKILECFYDCPAKILSAILNPIQARFEESCLMLLDIVRSIDENSEITKKDIATLLSARGKSCLLGMYNHFAQLVVTSKTIIRLNEYESKNNNHVLQKILIHENFDTTENFIKYVEKEMKTNKNIHMEYMIKLIIRKHLLTHPSMNFKLRESISAKFFNKKGNFLELRK